MGFRLISFFKIRPLPKYEKSNDYQISCKLLLENAILTAQEHYIKLRKEKRKRIKSGSPEISIPLSGRGKEKSNFFNYMFIIMCNFN